MTIGVVFFDLGGVIVRTEFQAPRERLAQRLGMTYEGLVKLVFEGESSRRASLGEISTQEHWAAVIRALSLPPSAAEIVGQEFFAGDFLDRELLNFIRSLRPHYKTGLISNAWPDLRDYIVRSKFDDAFDEMVISAEVGLMKPDPRIYHLALQKTGVAPAAAVFLDDFAENIEAARAVGMYAIQFTQPEKALEELKQLLANHR